MNFLHNKKAQQVMEYLVMAAVVVSTLVVFTRPSGVFRGAVNRILWMSTDQVNFAVNSLCIGPGCGSTCGDGVCSVADGEICFDPADPGPGACQLDCGLCPMCPDGTCDFGETCATCPIDCGPCPAGPCNYDSHCDAGENYLTCPDCAMPDCGNGMPNPGEQCDTGEFVGGLTDFFGQACVDFVDPAGSVNYHASCGFLVCNPYATGPGVRCTVDTSNCCWCGDGDRNGPEECEGGQLGGMDCFQLGIILGINYTGGNLKCFPDGDPKECQYDTSECWICGNGIPELGEDCEVGIPVTQMCVPYGEKAAECYPPKDPLECQFDFRNCDYCGDGDINSLHEECDKGDSGALPPIPLNLDGQDCVIRGYDCGALGCAGDCKSFNESNCHECGDGTVNCPGEECDGSDHNGETCETLGLAGGTLNCFPKDDPGGNECKFDTSLCGICGDGIATSPEECDPGDPPAIGEDLAGEDCLSWATKNGLPYDNGELACYAKDLANKCTFDVSGCTECGNGTLEGYVEGYEECDDPEFPAGVDCTAFTTPAYAHDYFGDASLLACDANCEIDPSGCLYCGDGTISGPPAYTEECDINASPPIPPSQSHCEDYPGYCRPTLAEKPVGPRDPVCDSNCAIDLSNCQVCGDDFCADCESDFLSLTACQADCATACHFDINDYMDCSFCGGEYCVDSDVALPGYCEQLIVSTCDFCPAGFIPDKAHWGSVVDIQPADCDSAPGGSGEKRINVMEGYTCVAQDTVFVTTPVRVPCCGDGDRNGTEQCEGLDLGPPGITQCSDLPGYHSGTLSCYPADKANPDPDECTYNTDDCAGCGDGELDNPPEECDYNAVPPVPGTARCDDVALHYGDGTNLDCDTSCLIDYDNCARCGDGNVNVAYGEVCDGANFNGQDCTDYGFDSGSLTCSADCKTITTGSCTYKPCSFDRQTFGDCISCGGTICDDKPLAHAGTPCVQIINDTCSCNVGEYPVDNYISTTVTQAVDCDNGIPKIEHVEVAGGVYTCDSLPAVVMPSEVPCCGDGNLDSAAPWNEDCDPDASPPVASDKDECADHVGFSGSGGVSCTANCQFDMSACGECGDLALNGDEECDYVPDAVGPGTHPDFGSHHCTDVGCYMEPPAGPNPMVCDPVTCKINYDACPCCGDGVPQPSEQCDPLLPITDDCEDLVFVPGPQYGPGPLTCHPKGTKDSGNNLIECTYDTSQCTCFGSDSLDVNAIWCPGDNSNLSAPAMTTLVDDQSDCTAGNECEAYCTDGPPNYVVDSAMCVEACGNGVLDAGETCDPGNPGLGIPPAFGMHWCDEIVGKTGDSSKLECINNCTEINYDNCDDACGNGYCEADELENCITCEIDCGECSGGSMCTYNPGLTYWHNWVDTGKMPMDRTEISWMVPPHMVGVVYPDGPRIISGVYCSDEAKYAQSVLRSGSMLNYYYEVCREPYACGDGEIDCAEICDPGGHKGALPKFDFMANCQDFDSKYYDTKDGLECSADCGTVLPTDCPYCGDGIRQGTWEECEKSPLDLGTATCENQGYDGGTLDCDADCDYDYSGCTRVCTGNKPAHSTLCTPPGGNMTASKAVNECSGGWCEYLCDPGYVTHDGVTCVEGCYTYTNQGDCESDPDCEWFYRPKQCSGSVSGNDCKTLDGMTNCTDPNSFPHSPANNCSVNSTMCEGTFYCESLPPTIEPCVKMKAFIGYSYTGCTISEEVAICKTKSDATTLPEDGKCGFSTGAPMFLWRENYFMGQYQVFDTDVIPFWINVSPGQNYVIYGGYIYFRGAYLEDPIRNNSPLEVFYELCRYQL